MKSLSKETKSNLICGICHNSIVETTNAYQSEFLLIPVCEDCINNFSNNDLEMMLNMFLVYGGYFGQYRKEKFSLKKLIKNIEGLDNKNENNFEEINIRMMHTALIHGLTPREYSSLLKELL